jgi:hypothetical protein
MSIAPHFRTNPTAASIFDRFATRGDVASAVRNAIALGCAVDRSDVETPHIEELERQPRETKNEYALKFAHEIDLEKRALRLIEGQANIRREQDANAAQAKAVEREQAIELRARAIEAEYFAALRTSWRAQATAEIDGTSNGPQQPQIVKARRTPARV